MPQLLNVENFIKETNDPREEDTAGFKLTYKYNGVSPRAVKGRAVGRLVSKYPLKAGEIEPLSVRVPEEQGGGAGANTYEVEIFVPNESLGDRATETIERLIEKAKNV